LKWAEYTLLLVLIALAGVLLPEFDYLAYVFMPLPVMFMTIRYDLKYGLIGLGSSVLVLLYTFQPFQPDIALPLLQYGTLGIVLGLFFKKLESSGRILVYIMLTAVGLAVAASGTAYLINGENPLVLSSEESQALSRQWSAMNERMRIIDEEEMINAASGDGAEPFQYLTEVFQYYLPAYEVVAAAVTAAFTYVLAIFLLGRYGYKVQPGPAFSEIHLPWYSIWALIIGLGLLLLGDSFNVTTAKIGKNILFILSNLYFIMGISVFVHYFKKTKVSLLFKILVTFTLLICYPISCICLVVIGAIDPLADFRRLTALK